MNEAEISKELTIAYIPKMRPSTMGDTKQAIKEDAERIGEVYTIIFKAVSAAKPSKP